MVVRWEEQVEKAFQRLPAEWVRAMVVNDENIWDDGEAKGTKNSVHPLHHKSNFLVGVGVTAGESHDRRVVTEKVVNDIRPTELEREGVDGVKDEESPVSPGHHNKLCT